MIIKKVVSVGKSRQLWLLLLIASIVFVYAFVVSAGHLGSWHVYMTYYDMLAEGFRAGHLYVPLDVSPKLLAKRDPFDFANSSLWLWDGSLYKGRYYLYWGPVPAVFLAAVKTILGINHPVGDPILSFVAFSLAAIFGALIIDRAGRRLFGAVPRWLRGLAIVAFALANPAPHLLASSGVYMACIGSGQAFALGGLLFAFDAVWEARRFDWRLSVAGALWALAMGSRATMIPVTGLLALVTLLTIVWPEPARLRRLLEAGALLLIPMACGVAALLLYNKLRFDDWFNVGINYQTTTLRFRMSPQYWLTNIYSYTLRPFFPECRFPYLIAPPQAGPRAFPEGMQVPEGYLLIEPLVGWLRAVPLTWLMLALPFAVVQRFRTLRARPEGLLDAKPRTFLWLVLCLGILASLSGIPAMWRCRMATMCVTCGGLARMRAGLAGHPRWVRALFLGYPWAHSRSRRTSL